MSISPDPEKQRAIVKDLTDQYPGCHVVVIVSDEENVLHFGYACLACARDLLAYVAGRLRFEPHRHGDGGEGGTGGSGGDGGGGKGAVM